MDYVSFGFGPKTLVLLPGLSDGLATVKGKALLLAKPYRLFFREYTVYMFSRKNELPEAYTIEEMADDQAEALKNLGIRKASVMGVSEGGMIAQALAIRRGELVEKLVLAVTAPRLNACISSCVPHWMELARKGDHKELMIDTAEKSYSPEKLKSYRKMYPVIGFVGKPKDYGRFLTNAEAILKFDVYKELKHISCPTFILGGAEDRIVGVRASYELQEQIPGSGIRIYPGLGHAAYEEAPDFNDRVFRFLEG